MIENLSRFFLISFILIISILFVACLLSDTALFLKGREIGSSLWLMKTEYPLLGIGFWLATFSSMSGGFLYFFRKKLDRNNNWLFGFGVLFALICYCFFSFFVLYGSRRDIPACGTLFHLFIGMQ